MQAPARELALAEYADRRNDILQRILRIEEQIRYGLLASGAIWTWLLTNTEAEWFRIAAWIPFVLVGFLTISWGVQHYAIMGIAKYVKKLEGQFSLPSGVGWESNITQYRNTWLVRTTTGFWALLVLMNLAAAICFSVSIAPGAKLGAATVPPISVGPISAPGAQAQQGSQASISLPPSQSSDVLAAFDLALRLAEALVWPLTILLLVGLFRPHLASLIGRLKSWDSPVGRLGFDEGTAPAPPSSLTDKQSPVQATLGDMAKRILNTLWHYQQRHFSDQTKGRWTFGLHPESPLWREYTRGIAELFGAELAVHNPANGQVLLTDRGIDYCRSQAASLGGERFTFPE